MIPHPKTMQMETDQRWHELQVRVAHERLGLITLLVAGNREISHHLTWRRIARRFLAAAGSAPGATVFAVGSGTGDVADAEVDFR